MPLRRFPPPRVLRKVSLSRFIKNLPIILRMAHFPGRFSLGRVSVISVSLTVAVGAAYAAVALASTTFFGVPAFGVALWPAAGLGLAAVARWGWRAVPGLAIGATAGNSVWLAADGAQQPALFLSALIASVGAVIQAGLAVRLVHRHLRPPFQYEGPRQILLTLTLCGPLASVFGASAAVVAQSVAATRPSGQWISNWFTWWVGNSAGVTLLAPLILLRSTDILRYEKGYKWAVAASVGVFTLASVGLNQWLSQGQTAAEQEVAAAAASAIAAVSSLDPSSSTWMLRFATFSCA